MDLFKASRQWAERPPDERFASLGDLDHACAGYRATAATASVPWGKLYVVTEGEDVVIQGPSENPARLTHWAFGQLCARAEAPASYLRELPADLAATCLTHGLAQRGAADADDQAPASLMFHRDNGLLLCRAITSDRYTRIWNSDVTKRLLHLEAEGWRVPPARPARENQLGTRPATEVDVLALRGPSSLTISVGDPIAPAGLYASDHDMFAFLVNESRTLSAGPNDTLGRGFFVWNSEVGAASFGIMTFLYRYVCGNHIVWGASNVTELRVRHIGEADARAMRELGAELRRYADTSASEDEQRIAHARSFKLGKDKDAVLDAIFRLRVAGLTRKATEAAILSTSTHFEDGDPYSAWGVAQGLTRVSQDLAYADDRVTLDRAAGKILQLAF